jgi:putative endonuclease
MLHRLPDRIGSNLCSPAFTSLPIRNTAALYAGCTSDIAARITQHRARPPGSFVGRYSTVRLVHTEFYERMAEAIQREKRIKKWKRV